MDLVRSGLDLISNFGRLVSTTIAEKRDSTSRSDPRRDEPPKEANQTQSDANTSIFNSHMSIPEESWKRSAIVILDQHAIERCSYEADSQDLLLNEEVSVVAFPFEQSHRIVDDLRDKGLLRPGKTLIQSPYNLEEYEDIEAAPERFALEKYMLFSEVCRRLGASRVEVKRVEAQRHKKKWSIETEGGYRAVGAEVEVENESLQRLKDELTLENLFEGGNPDAEYAEKLLREKRLWGDPSMKGLVQLRRGEKNQLKKHSMTINLSRESEGKMDVVSQITVPSFLNLKADFDRVVKNKQTYTIEVVVEF